MARFIHVGNHAVSGNGFLGIHKCTDPLYPLFIETLEKNSSCQSGMVSEDILVQLKNLTYCPKPYKEISIYKNKSEKRMLHLASEIDLAVQREFKVILEKVFEPHFFNQSFAYRRGKGAFKAIKCIIKWKKSLKNNMIVIRCDVDDFFDTIPIDKLLHIIYRKTKDARITYMISLWMKTGVITNEDNKEIEFNEIGIPQGSALSPLLANIYLHKLDEIVIHRISPFYVRYADDLFIICAPDRDPLRFLQLIGDFLKDKLFLKLNHEYFVGELKDTFSFLGIEFLPDGTLDIEEDKKHQIPIKAVNALNINTVTFKKLNEFIDGLRHYYGKLLPKKSIHEIDEQLVKVYSTYIPKHFNKSEYKKVVDVLSQCGFIGRHFIDGKWISMIKSVPMQAKRKTATIKSKLRKQHKDYLQHIEHTYELIVNHPGAFLGLNKNKIRIRHEGKTVTTHSLKDIQQISIMCQGVGLSSNITKYCSKNNIAVVFYDHIGNSYAAIKASNQIEPDIMKAQMELSDEKKVYFIKKLVQNKIKNQKKLLQYFYKYYKNETIGQGLNAQIDKMNIILDTMPQDDNYETLKKNLFLWEARAAGIYWKAFALIIERSGNSFEKRLHQGADDAVNQMLNYAYALLESKVKQTLSTWKLNPYISYLHSMKKEEACLCFDLMEQYRTFIVDRSIIAILTKGEKVGQEKNSGLLTWETRKKIISKLNERWFTLEKYKAEDKSLSEIMHLLTKNFKDFCLGKTDKLKFYTPKW